MGMPVGSNDVQEERALTPALSGVGVSILLMVPGSRGSQFLALPYITSLFAGSRCQYQLFFTANGLQAVSYAFCPAYLWLVAWRREGSPWADLPVLLDTEIKEISTLGLCLTALFLVCSTKEVLFVCFHSSLGLGKKGLKDSYIFFKAVFNQRSCKISISEIYVICIARQWNYRQSWDLSCINRGGNHLLGTVPSVIT